MKFAVIDIETIPNQSLSEDMKSDFAKTVKAGNLGAEKAQEKIDKKMSLDPDLCEIIAFVGYRDVSQDIPSDIAIHPECSKRGIVNLAWNVISECYLDHIPLVSYNGIAFDLPVLWHQAMRLNIPVSPQMYSDLTKKYENRFHYDLMQLLANWDKSKWKSLDFYLKLFNIGTKSGDGSDIYTWWKSGDYDKIRLHCEEDVKLTAKLFERLQDYIVREDRHDNPF